jgi:hypothetical protein
VSAALAVPAALGGVAVSAGGRPGRANRPAAETMSAMAIASTTAISIPAISISITIGVAAIGTAGAITHRAESPSEPWLEWQLLLMGLPIMGCHRVAHPTLGIPTPITICGGAYYQPQYEGDTVVYVSVPDPATVTVQQ